MPDIVTQPTAAPTRKVAYGALAGAPAGLVSAGTIVLVWAWIFPDSPMPQEVAEALLVGLTWLGHAVVSYATKEHAKPLPMPVTASGAAAEVAPASSGGIVVGDAK